MGSPFCTKHPFRPVTLKHLEQPLTLSSSATTSVTRPPHLATTREDCSIALDNPLILAHMRLGCHLVYLPQDHELHEVGSCISVSAFPQPTWQGVQPIAGISKCQSLPAAHLSPTQGLEHCTYVGHVGFMTAAE